MFSAPKWVLSHDHALNAENIRDLSDLIRMMSNAERIVMRRCFHDPFFNELPRCGLKKSRAYWCCPSEGWDPPWNTPHR